MEDYFDPVDSISDFQDEDEEGQDSPMHSRKHNLNSRYFLHSVSEV